MPIPDPPFLKLIMKISLKPKQPLKSWIETSEKSSNMSQENMLIQSTTKEEKKE